MNKLPKYKHNISQKVSYFHFDSSTETHNVVPLSFGCSNAYKQQKIAVALKSFLKLYDWVHFTIRNKSLEEKDQEWEGSGQIKSV